jgi:IS30 family transposase
VPLFAQDKASERRRNAKNPWRMEHPQLLNFVKKMLKVRWTPEDIANRLPILHPGDPKMRVSAPTIYAWVERDRQQGGTYYTYLRLNQGRKYRRRRGLKGQKKRGAIIGRVGIEHRPEIVETRERFGDWEGDTIVGKGKSGCIVTLVERKSRFLVAVKVDSKEAVPVADATLQEFRKVPKCLRETMTLDNGSEFAQFPQIQVQLGTDVYFADPHAPWQRGTNENTNGLLRQFFPKGTSFHNVSTKKVVNAVKLLNDRPRRCLDYKTPSEVFQEAIAAGREPTFDLAFIS